MTAPTISRQLGITEDPCTPEENSKCWDRVRRLFNDVFNTINIINEDGDETTTINLFNDLVVYFKLTADLDPTVGSATATKYEYDNTTDSWVAGGTITVYDETTSKVWRGKTGYQGFARRKAADSSSRHSILFLERIARDIWGTLNGPFSNGEAQGVVSHFSDGVEPTPSPVTIFDRLERFPEAAAGSKFRAQYDYKEGRYEIIECQQKRWIATAYATSAFDETSVVVPIYGFTPKSWPEYDIDPTAPQSANNTFLLSGSANDPLHLQKSEDSTLWEIITAPHGGAGAASQLVRFRLYGNLNIGGSALAKRLVFNGVGYDEVENITVFDAPYGVTFQDPGNTRGMWGPGIPYMEGWARKREAGLNQYSIVFMEMFGRFVFFELTQDMGEDLPNQATAKIALGGVFGQGDSVVDPQEFIVHDDNDLFHFAKEGAKGLAVRNEYMQDGLRPNQPYYQACVIQQPFLYGKALLESDMCPGDASASISELQGWTPSIFNQRLPIADEQSSVNARNTFDLAGEEADVVYFVVEYDFQDDEEVIHIVQVQHKELEVVTDVRYSNDCIQKRKRKIAVMYCEDEGEYENVLCFEECLN